MLRMTAHTGGWYSRTVLEARRTHDGLPAGFAQNRQESLALVLQAGVDPEWHLIKVYISRPQELTDQRWALRCFR